MLVAFMPMAPMVVVMAFVVMAFMIVFEAQIRRLGCLRLWIIFDGVGRTQRFLPSMRCARRTNCLTGVQTAYFLPHTAGSFGILLPRLPPRAKPAPRSQGIPHLMVRGFAGRVKPDAILRKRLWRHKALFW
jgi:hypothetical protein